ncbi:MAG: SUMF1/EgtB/PvdO family nonheme iron enzyme [Acidobacteria bacterium]|nr:SUMF1/EgtB/PvdO family nonheme iron enzyme [Acidobacteriota bacterium]
MAINRVDSIIGRTLGDFLVKEKLGEGGFGAVYKATQITLAREAVIKILHTRHRTNQVTIERFKREALLASRLEHPYCAHIYSFGAESDGLLWIAMELVQGTPLNKILKSQGPLPLEKFVPLLDKICEVVHTAHERGIIHRDLKPANVMVISRAGRLLPKLLDFGIAKGLSLNVSPASTSPNKAIAKQHSSESIFSILPNELQEPEQIKKHNAQETLTIINKLTSSNGSNGSGSKSQNTIFDESSNGAINDNNDNNDNNENTVIENVFTGEKTLIIDYVIKGQETVIEVNNEVNKNGKSDFLSKKTDANKQLATDPKGFEGQTNIEEYTIKTQGFIGSPPYMSPEQWQNGANVDVRSDIYSLGVLAYQVIMGELPFKEQGFELYGAHAAKPVPQLKENLPSRLNQVIQKALAKKPEERYQTTLDFAKAFREATNFDDEKVTLPLLDEILKENILTNAPKPLADTVASLLASRNAYQFRDRLLLVFRVLVRYLGILALASYVSSTHSQEQDNESTNKFINTLRKEGLNESQWIELSRELCRAFANKRDAFPIPELVSLFFASGSEQLSPLTETFSQLLDLQRDVASTTSLKEEKILTLLIKFLDKLNVLLRATLWLADYYLVIPEDQKATKWMGVSKELNRITLKNTNLVKNKAILVDSNGYLVLSLWPLVEIAPPTPEALQEVFLLERKGRSGAKSVSFPEGFEIETEAPWEWLKNHFFTDDDKSQADILLEKSPYLGLTSFSKQDSALFFGREKETESFLNRLRIQSLLTVIGSSGAGKSSFIQAGVIAGLDKNWQVLTVRPGLSPLITLFSKLLQLGIDSSNLKTDLQKDINALGKVLRRFAIRQHSKFLLVIDQFEEIITLCSDKEEQKLYVEAIISAARSEDDPVRVILTMRDDFLVRAKELRGLKDRLSQGLEILTTPDSTQLLRILTEPAYRAGYEFEDTNLPLEIVDQLIGQPSALPLLAFTTAKLWEQRDKQFKQLRRRSYEAMGGVVGALAKHAEELMQQLTQAEQSLVREAFRHLVTSEGTRAVFTRPELLQLLGKSSDSEKVLEKLISARLLIATEGEKGVERIEIIHEALLSAWPRLVKWRQEMAEGARLRDQLRSAARQWEERGRPKGLLWRHEALAEYQLWRSHYKGKLTDLEEEFAQASILDATRSQRIKRNLIIAAMLILIIGSAVLFYQRYQTKQQLLETLKLYEEQGRQEMLRGNLEGAAVYLSEAYSKGADSLALKYMLSVALAKVENRPPVTLDKHTDAITMAMFSPDDSLVATASKDKTARLWQVWNGKELFNLKGHEDIVTSVNFSSDGKFLVTASLDKTAKVWDVFNGGLLFTLSGHTDGLNKALFSPDGKQIVTISYDKTAKIWDSRSGRLIKSLEDHKSPINAVSYNKDSSLIATASSDRVAKIWDSKSGELKNTLSSHQGAIVSIDFSPDGKLLITGSIDKTAKVWQIPEGKLLHTLKNHQAGITDVKFSLDGKNILVTSTDTKASLWDTSGVLTAILEGHNDGIAKGEFSPDGKFIITSSYDKTLRMWEKSSGRFLVALAEHEESLNSGIFSGKGEKILTASEDKKAKIWQIVAETHIPSEVSKVVKEKVNMYLQEGRLIIPELKKSVNPENIETNEISKNSLNNSLDNNLDNNLYVEDLGSGIKIELVKISAGVFDMGSPLEEQGHNVDENLHKVTISSGFYIGKYEITQEQWKAVVALPKINKSLNSSSFFLKGEYFPVNNISWEDAVEFCARLSKATGKKYRLPTESEWEYACRAGTKGSHSGNLDEMAWYVNNSLDKLNVVGLKKSNPWGLYDMYGNVWEFCLDWYGDYPKEHLVDPKGPNTGHARVVRGGSWFTNCRSADRASATPSAREMAVGFRLVMEE